MLTLLAALALAAPQETATKEEPIKALVARMYARYYGAKTVRGSFVLTQVATGGASANVRIATEFAIEKPSRLFIAQTDSRRPGRTYTVTSDGERLTYDDPGLDTPAGRRRLERVSRPEGTLEVPELYLAARQSLPDVFSPFLSLGVSMAGISPTLEAAPMAKTTYMARFNAGLVTMTEGARATVAGRECRVAEGAWRANPQDPPTGRYQLYVTPGGDLVRYRTEQRISVAGTPAAPGTPAPNVEVTVVSDWTGEAVVDAPIEPAVFRVKL